MNLSNKKFLITGGTGSFGNTVCKYLLKNNVKQIRIFSRDENKQDIMRNYLKDSRVNFIGDIRDYDSIFDTVITLIMYFRCCIVQVPSCEFHLLKQLKQISLGLKIFRERHKRYKKSCSFKY